ncbi:MAG TPA: trigger factor [Chthonomonadaceae bacterium]|nr:trigger factor [Chthonomonadaceae bacterium]
MEVTAEQTDPCTIVLDISLDEQQVARTFDSVYREFSRYANIPGFRPGKAPRAIVERFVNPEKVRERALEKLISDSYFKAIQEEAIEPYREPRIEPTDLEDKKPYTYKAIVPLEPQVTLGEYTGLTVEKPVYTITEADVDRAIERLREGRARLDRVTDRGVEEGDVLIAELQAAVEGEENPQPARRQLVQVGQNSIPGFDQAVMGMMPGEERTFEAAYPEDHPDENLRGKKVTYTVRLSSISARKLPELNDEFAKQVAGVDTVEELRQRIREREERGASELSNQIAEGRLIQEIVNRATIHFPEVLVQEEVEAQFRQLASELRQRGMTFEQYLAQTGQTAEQYQQAVREQAVERLRSVLALREIARQEGLEVADEQIDAEFDRLLNEGKISEEDYERYKDNRGSRLRIANELVRERLHDFLFANNNIQEVAAPTAPDPAELEAASAEAEAESQE